VRDALVPLATVVTPNLDEAAILCGFPVRTEAEMARAGADLVARGAGGALIKGGHLAGDDLVELLVTRDATHRFAHRRIATTSTHGTGCTSPRPHRASHSLPLEEAVSRSPDYFQRAIAAALDSRRARPGQSRHSGDRTFHQPGHLIVDVSGDSTPRRTVSTTRPARVATVENPSTFIRRAGRRSPRHGDMPTASAPARSSQRISAGVS
jgi:hydroxymethylpyrimidine/phosphomethylpyrimidine kinase